MMSNIQENYEKNKGNPFKTLLALYQGNYKRLLVSALLYIVKDTPAWISPLIMSIVIDTITKIKANSLRTVIFCGIFMIFLILQNIISNYFHTKFYSTAIRHVEANLRGALIRKLQQLSISYQKDLKSGVLQSKIMRDVETVQTLSSQIFISLLSISVNMFVALAITLVTSRIVFLFFIATIPIATFLIKLFSKQIESSNSDFRHEMEQTSAKVMEMIHFVPMSRAHALENQEISRLRQQFDKIFKKGIKLDVLQAFFGSVSWSVFQLFQVFCLIFTAILAIKGKITPGEVVMYQTYFGTVVASAANLINLIPMVAKGVESVNSIGEILISDKVETHQGQIEVAEIKGQFSFENVYFSYENDKNIIKGLNLTVKSGETIALVGASGSGKTTILNLAIGFIAATSGRLLLDGQEMSTLNLHSVRKHIAVVPQNSILLSGTIRDNITYGADDVTDAQLEKVLQMTNLKDVIDKLPDGVKTEVGENGDMLSGGQKQRISIARALIRDPKVIVMDEATSALDVISEKKIQESLVEMQKNRTTFIVAHRLSTIRNADRIAVIQSGKCVEIGTFEELMALKGEFYQMQKLQ
ncbi:ABC transporter [Lactococcus hodotermopsidis]|uniref:Multidrug resistance ABC transporter ATP-binding and permease protein n=1 Tax=Pseudolactococcus hodotermopsidis TaxID=2709157 RepID=A0A6A0BF29_9LACT|nr:ABC transporter ATP-binding protein [Lactococcus hodotermopsidis]GFH43305.1 ABC transporter [Lactococcus hodotermopsidis]